MIESIDYDSPPGAWGWRYPEVEVVDHRGRVLDLQGDCDVTAIEFRGDEFDLWLFDGEDAVIHISWHDIDEFAFSATELENLRKGIGFISAMLNESGEGRMSFTVRCDFIDVEFLARRVSVECRSVKDGGPYPEAPPEPELGI